MSIGVGAPEKMAVAAEIRTFAFLGASWLPGPAPLRSLEPVGAHLGSVWGHLGRFSGSPWALLGSSWIVFGSFWREFEAHEARRNARQRLNPAPPKGCSCARSLAKSCPKSPKTPILRPPRGPPATELLRSCYGIVTESLSPNRLQIGSKSALNFLRF